MRLVPHTAYFYWGNTVLPFLRYMAMVSFKLYNPDWNVILFTPKKLTQGVTWSTCENKVAVNTVDYMSRLRARPDIITCPFDMDAIGYSNDLPEVIKSDLIRLYLLSEYGGLWSDNDIVYFRPITSGLPVDDSVAHFCYRRGGPTQDPTPKNGPEYHSIGFLLGAPHNPYFTKLFAGARSVMKLGEYQSVGSPYYATQIDIHSPGIYNIPIHIVYPSRAALAMCQVPAQNHLYEIRPNSIGWHWYAGAPASGQLQNVVTEATYRNYDNIVCHLLNRVLLRETV